MYVCLFAMCVRHLLEEEEEEINLCRELRAKEKEEREKANMRAPTKARLMC